jgi:hypothetical protein
MGSTGQPTGKLRTEVARLSLTSSLEAHLDNCTVSVYTELV